MSLPKIPPRALDRRRFLLGAGGALLALPMLELHTPRKAQGADTVAPKRLIVVMHPHGRTVGNGHLSDGSLQDNWSPRADTGPLKDLPALSPLLASLSSIRNQIVTLDGLDNLVRHMTGNADGHLSSSRTCLTCMPQNSDQTAAGPSIDYVAGQRLRASESQRSSIIFPASPTATEYYDHLVFFGAGGTQPSRVSSNPGVALVDLFGSAAAMEPTASVTLRDRLVAQRGSILDAVNDRFTQLKTQVTTRDRVRLEQHADFIRALETRLTDMTPVGAGACTRPDESAIPTYTSQETARGGVDGLVTPYQIENLVMALACDVTRVACLHFQLNYDPAFQSEFDADSPLGGTLNYHSLIHETPHLDNPAQSDITHAFGFYGKMFARLITRLGEIPDIDGRTLLDNTLVVWASDLGYGSSHYDFNIPVVLAGMPTAFPNGQGRHVVQSERRSLGDLYAQVLRMLGGEDETFGYQGTLGDSGLTRGALNEWSAASDAYIDPSLDVHRGPLEL